MLAQQLRGLQRALRALVWAAVFWGFGVLEGLGFRVFEGSLVALGFGVELCFEGVTLRCVGLQGVRVSKSSASDHGLGFRV